MKNIILLLLGLVISGALKAQTRLTIPLQRPGQPYNLDVHIGNGSVRVSGYDGQAIEVMISGDPVDEKNQQVSSTLAQNIVADQDGNRIIIHELHPGKLVNLELKIPRRLILLKLATVHGGIIEASGISGQIEASNVSGGIKLSDVSGSVVATTEHGDLSVSFRTVDPGAPMAFSTLSGDITVTFPAGLKANTRIKCDHGLVSTDFKISAVNNETSAAKRGAGLRFTADSWRYGKIGGGGPELQFSNTYGNITIHQIK